MTMSTTPTVLVTGATGLLGRAFVHHLANSYKVYALSRRPTPQVADTRPLAVDLTDTVALKQALNSHKPDYIIHTAALASIERCEQDPQLARRLNVEAPEALATWCAQSESRMIHISTDAVFDGAAGPYDETQTATPQSVYGATKLAGEQAVLAAEPGTLVARVNFFGWSATGSRSLAEFFLNSLAQGKSVPGFRDIEFASLYNRDLVELICEADAQRLKGVWHFASSDAMSKYDFGRLLAATFGYDPSLVLPSESSRHGELVSRTKKLAISAQRLEQALGKRMPTFAQGVKRMMSDQESSFRLELVSRP